MALGTRTVIKEEQEKGPQGKLLNKLVLGDYTWLKYKDLASTPITSGGGSASWA